MDLTQLRAELDKVDSQLEQCFIKRMEIVASVAEYKRANNLPTLDSAREQQVLDKHAANVDAKFDSFIRDYFTNVMRISREYQDELRKE